MTVKSNVDGKFLMFHGKPLVRQGHMLCYGNMQDKYVMMMMIMRSKEVETGGKKNSVPEKVIVQIAEKDPSNPANRIPIKQFDKNGLHDAFMIGYNYMRNLQSSNKTEGKV